MLCLEVKSDEIFCNDVMSEFLKKSFTSLHYPKLKIYIKKREFLVNDVMSECQKAKKKF
jgi:hypothetical protein